LDEGGEQAARVAGGIAASTTHRGDHRGLLAPPRLVRATDAKVDAIIVPSARTAPYLLKAAGLAEQLNCVLVVLCSKRAKRHEVVAYLEDRVVLVDVVAVDMPGVSAVRLPPLRTTAMLKGTPLARRTDTSGKRNAGLALSHMVGWERVVFLDDDITVPDPLDLRRAVAALRDHDGVGLHIGGYPDNSVVCHAYRETGGWQQTFVGGGALAVPACRTDSFFPEIYNEDWLFLLGDTGLRRTTVVGEAKQEPYDPFADPKRARREEFGDVLAEGIFALLDQGLRIQDADEAYWASSLHQRRSLIDGILARVERTGAVVSDKGAMVEALKAARGRLLLIKPATCVAYLRAWQTDRATWRTYLRRLPRNRSVEDALAYLRLLDRATVRWNRTHAPVEHTVGDGQPVASEVAAS
jgi:hypothetical protein